MMQGEEIEKYISNNFSNNALTIYSISDDSKLLHLNKIKKVAKLVNDIFFISKNKIDYSKREFNKKYMADYYMKHGITFNNPINEELNPKGLVEDILDIEDTITNKAHYFDKEVCNIAITTPQVIEDDFNKYFCGYPKDNVSGYITAKKQKDFDCFLTDILRKSNKIYPELISGYYYKDNNGDSFFNENKNSYINLDDDSKKKFFKKLINDIDDNYIDISNSEKKDIFKYISDTIKSNKKDYNSKYLTVLEYIEYQNKKVKSKELSKDEFVNLLKANYGDYGLYLHGLDQDAKFSSKLIKMILRTRVDIDDEYGMAGTFETRGLVKDSKSLHDDLDYHYGDNNEKSYNLIVLTPNIVDDLDKNAYFVGNSRRNTTGTFPKSMKDFDCIFSDIVNDKGYLPKEFILAYQVYGPNIEEKFIINKNHISFMSCDLQRVFITDFLNTDNKELRNRIETFKLSNINYDLMKSYSYAISVNGKIGSVATTAKEYLEYVDDNKKLNYSI